MRVASVRSFGMLAKGYATTTSTEAFIMSMIPATSNGSITRLALACLTVGFAFPVHLAESKAVSLNQIVDFKDVASIRVLCTPEREFVRIALTPELLIANYQSSFELDRSASTWDKFEHSAAHTTLETSGERGDHRWAILFRDSSGRTKRTLVIDRKRRLANLDGKV